MKLSLRQAAAEVGKSKSTILRSIQSGRLSADRLDDGGYAIDPAELFRVYSPRSVADNDAEGQDATPELTSENMVLRTELEALRETVRRLDDQLDDVREDRDRWRSSAENAQRLLTVEREKPVIVEVPAPPAPAPVSEGLIARLAKALKG